MHHLDKIKYHSVHFPTDHSYQAPLEIWVLKKKIKTCFRTKHDVRRTDRNDKSSPIWCTKIILRHHYCTAVRILQILEFEYNQVLSYTLQALARATDPPTRKRTSHAIFSWITLQLSRWGILVGFSSLWSKEYKTTPPQKKRKKRRRSKNTFQ